ncbi:MAG: YlxR family protein [Acidimicrobiia bacterium]
MTRSAPHRTCVGCRRTAPVAELVRLRWTPRGLELGRGPGRGAWLCGSHPVACLDRVARRPVLAKALRAPVTSGDLERVRATLETGNSVPREGKPEQGR